LFGFSGILLSSKKMFKFISDFSNKLNYFKVEFLKIDYENNLDFFNEINVKFFPTYKFFTKEGLVDEIIGSEPVLLLKKIRKLLFK
jgi:hypothetical protein